MQKLQKITLYNLQKKGCPYEKEYRKRVTLLENTT